MLALRGGRLLVAAPSLWAPLTSAYRGLRTMAGSEHISWLPPENQELTVLEASLREIVGETSTKELKGQKRVPIVVQSRHPNAEIRKKQRINAHVCERQLSKILDKGRAYNQVFAIKLPDREEPVKAVVGHLYRQQPFDEPINVIFDEYRPEKRHKVQVPCWFDNRLESFALKKGAYLQKVDDFIPCYWRGDLGGELIPRGLVIDLLHARPPTTFQLDPKTLPEGLTLRYPHHTYTLALLKGTRKYRASIGEAAIGDDQAEEEEENV